MGSPRALSQTLEARTLTAYHEGGHALVALHTPGAKPIHKATIQPRGHALGMVTQLPDADEYSTTKRQMLAHVDVCMGGKAAEELIFGEDSVTSGATSDLRAATRLARHMVEECGMSAAVGPVAIAPGDGAAPGVRAAVDAEVAAMLKAAYARVAALLRAREGELHALAAALLERETLTQQEIRDVLGLGGAAPAGAPAAEAAAATAPVAAAAGK
jgi:ATP-dependent metalloprotease